MHAYIPYTLHIMSITRCRLGAGKGQQGRCHGPTCGGNGSALSQTIPGSINTEDVCSRETSLLQILPVLQPISQQYRRRKVLCEFVAHTAQVGLKYQTIKTYLSAVRNWQVISGMGDPFRSDLPLLEYVPRGVRMDQARNREGSPVERLLITPDILLKVRVILEQNRMSFDNIMLWAVYCTAFLGVSAFSRANRTFSGSI